VTLCMLCARAVVLTGSLDVIYNVKICLDWSWLTRQPVHSLSFPNVGLARDADVLGSVGIGALLCLLFLPGQPIASQSKSIFLLRSL
jgi:hypothetical protein